MRITVFAPLVAEQPWSAFNLFFRPASLHMPRAFADVISSVCKSPPSIHRAGSFSFFKPRLKYQLLREASLSATSTSRLWITATSPISYLGAIFVSFIALVPVRNYCLFSSSSSVSSNRLPSVREQDLVCFVPHFVSRAWHNIGL